MELINVIFETLIHLTKQYIFISFGCNGINQITSKEFRFHKKNVLINKIVHRISGMLS